MNFLAIETLKNSRDCRLSPSSMSLCFSLNETLESARMGISTAGFSAFFTVRSVSPASFSILASVFLARSARIFSCFTGGAMVH